MRSAGSAPAITPSISALSSTDLVIGPALSRDHASGVTPYRLTRPYVGFMPTMPQYPDGRRIDPPVSVPSAPAQNEAQTAAPDPLLEPETERSRFHGLRVGCFPVSGF